MFWDHYCLYFTSIVLHALNYLLEQSYGSMQMTCHSDHSYGDIQKDIYSLWKWASDNYLSFNTSKCKQMVLYGCADTDVLFRPYTALVRPHLDYACEVWNPHLLKDKEELVRVKILALRLCIKQRDIVDLLIHFNTLSLADGSYLSVCIMYKIIHGLAYFHQNIFIPKSSTMLRTSNNLLYAQPFASTYSFLYPFSCSKWNKLPPDVIHASSLSHYIHLLHTCMHNTYSLPFSCSRWNKLPPDVIHASSLSHFKSVAHTCIHNTCFFHWVYYLLVKRSYLVHPLL